MKITDAPNTDELRAKASRVHSVEREIAELQGVIASDETEHRAARAQAVLNGTPAPTEPKTIAANRKKLADMVETLPLAQTGLNVAITQAKNQAHERYTQLAAEIENECAERQSDILGRMLPLIAELSVVIGDTGVLRLFDSNTYSAHLLRNAFLKEYTNPGDELKPGLAAVPKAIEALISNLKTAGHPEHLIDTMARLEGQLAPHVRKDN